MDLIGCSKSKINSEVAINPDSCPVGTRFIYKIRDEHQNSWKSNVYEDLVLEWAASGMFVKCRTSGWRHVEFFSFFEVLGFIESGSEMCPNCATPRKRNDPHRLELMNSPEPEEQEFPLRFHKEETG
jgi:hypothetical protein